MNENSLDPSSPQLSPLSSSLPLSGETVAFTGTLASMVHRDAMALVATYGGRTAQSVSRSTTMLVVGEEGWPLEEDGAASQKLVQAAQLITEGVELRIVSESDWLHLIGLNERRDEIQRSYTPAMLSRLLDLPVRLIRRWGRIGLIRPEHRVGRLQYFDFREVASAQRLAQLLDEGVRSEVLERSLIQLRNSLSGTDRTLAQLNLLVQDEKVVMRDAHGVLIPRTGQRLLDFDAKPESSSVPSTSAPVNDLLLPFSKTAGAYQGDASTDDEEMPVSFSIEEARLRQDDRSMREWSAEEWFHEGCRLSDEAEFESAVNAFRNCLSLLTSDQMMLRDPQYVLQAGPTEVFPDPADVHFHLADALYRSGMTEAAIERYHCAIECAPDFIEAWTQLGCLQTERQHWVPAETALLTAIAIHDSNPDALLHYAQLLEQMKRHDESLTYWKKYLQYDSRGPWADHARKRLAEAAEPVSTPDTSQ